MTSARPPAIDDAQGGGGTAGRPLLQRRPSHRLDPPPAEREDNLHVAITLHAAVYFLPFTCPGLLLPASSCCCCCLGCAPGALHSSELALYWSRRGAFPRC
ncbi:uncharacterized protein [Lolium perenne]|uniref:uncharacterized protein n=1 Tax=Lolium perenne TaxID=4522 RepID=UPI0021F54CBC|nr:uncharacterized protein LOC127326218 [Lolium perenne]